MHALTYTARAVRAQGLDSCHACVKFCLTDFFAMPTDRGTQEPGDNLISQQSATSTMWPVSRVQYGALR